MPILFIPFLSVSTIPYQYVAKANCYEVSF
jgi:hypothetical protein